MTTAALVSTLFVFVYIRVYLHCTYGIVSVISASAAVGVEARLALLSGNEAQCRWRVAQSSVERLENCRFNAAFFNGF